MEKALGRAHRQTYLDRSFISRVILTAVSFLVVYLFFSIVIRDPIPLVDELALGGLAATLAWAAMIRRKLGSAEYQEGLARLLAALGSAAYAESTAVSRVEAWMREALDAARAGSAAFEAWLSAPAASPSLGEAEELSVVKGLLLLELSKPSLVGFESKAELMSRLHRQALRLSGGRYGGGKASRLRRFSALYLKIDRVLEEPHADLGSGSGFSR